MSLTLRRIPIKKINPAPYNPRIDLQPGDVDYEKLKRSIDEFGCVEPLVWNPRTGHLVGGHQRFKILVARGDRDVEVSVVSLSLEREKALNIALNKIQGDWDEDRLAALLRELSALPDFDVSLTGFDAADLSALFDRNASTDASDEDGFDLADAVDAAEALPPVTKPGECIHLGEHRLLCGDSSKPDHQALLLDGWGSADLLFTDPPYNVDYYGGNRPTPKKARPKPSRNWKRIYSDNLSQGDYEKWFRGIIENAFPRLSEGASFYIWNGHRQFGPMHQMLCQLKARVSCVITWAKECFAIGYGDYNQQTEFCLYGWKSDASHRWYGPTNESTLWQINRDRTVEYRHPTQKPIALAARAVRNSTQRGDLVLDLFTGSGSTLMAADRLERRFAGIEIDSRYCDAIVRRYLASASASPKLAKLRQRYALPAQSKSAPVMGKKVKAGKAMSAKVMA